MNHPPRVANFLSVGFHGMPELTVVLPTFNERENAVTLAKAILEHCPWETEVVVVDDDSPDGTWQAVAELGQADPRVRLIRRTEERGLTTAIWAGIEAARGKWVGWMDCDLSMPPSKIPGLVRALRTYHVAVGTRYGVGADDARTDFLPVFLSRIINTLASCVLTSRIRDYTSGFVFARRPVFDRVTLRGDYGEYCIDFLYRAHRAGFTIVEMPYVCIPREIGESKTATDVWGFARRGWRYLWTIARLRCPGLLFGAL